MAVFLESLSSSDLKMIYRDQYQTAPLNAKFAVNTARGVYRGFNLEPDGLTVQTVKIVADPATGDHAAVYETASGFSVSVRRPSGDISLSFIPLIDPLETVEWVIAIYAKYTSGSATSGEIRAYTVAELDTVPEAPELIILGSVVVPAGLVTFFTDDEVSPARRTLPWVERASDAQERLPQVKNSDFRIGSATDLPFWILGTSWAWDAATLRGAEFTAGVALSSNLVQNLGTEVRAGDPIRAALTYEAIAVPSTGTLDLSLVFRAADGTESTKTLSLSTDLQTHEVEFTTVIPVDGLLDRIVVATGGDSLVVGSFNVRVTHAQVHALPSAPARTRGSTRAKYLYTYGVSGSYLLSSSRQTPQLRSPITSALTSNYNTLLHSAGASGTDLRIIRGPNGGFFHTWGCYYNNGANRWEKDSSVAYSLTIGDPVGEEFRFARVQSPEANWTDYDAATAANNDTGTGSLSVGTTSDKFVLGGDGKGHTMHSGNQYGVDGKSLWEWYDNNAGDNRIRYYVDWMGFPPGNLRRIDADWRTSPRESASVANNEDDHWFEFNAATTAPSPYFVGRHIVLSESSGSAHVGSYFEWDWDASPDNSRFANDLMAFSLRFQLVSEAVADIDVHGGVTSDAAYGASALGVWFRYDRLADDWLAEWGDKAGNLQSESTGYPWSDDTPMAFRIDFVGAEYDGGPYAVFYIDGDEVAYLTDTSAWSDLNGDIARIAVHADFNDPGAVYVSPLSLQYYQPSPVVSGDPRWGPTD